MEHPYRLIPVLTPVTADTMVQQCPVQCQQCLPIAAGRIWSEITFVISLSASCTDGSQSSTDKLLQRSSAQSSVQLIESLTYPHNHSSYPKSGTQKRQDRPSFSGNLPLFSACRRSPGLDYLGKDA